MHILSVSCFYVYFSFFPDDGLSSSEKSDLQQRLMAELWKHKQPRTALELAHALGLPTRKHVNSSLYDLKKRGILGSDENVSPPKWYLTSSSYLITSQNTSASLSNPSLQEDTSHRSRLVIEQTKDTPVEWGGASMYSDSSTDQDERDSIYQSYYDSVYMEDTPVYFESSGLPEGGIEGHLEVIFKNNPTAEMTDLQLAKATGHAYSRTQVRDSTLGNL